MMHKSTVVILGGTSAIGRALAYRYAKDDYAVVLACRDTEEGEIVAQDIRVRAQAKVYNLPWDATAFDTHEAFVSDCLERISGALAGVVVCAGYMDDQEVAQRDFTIARRTIDGTFTGVVSMLERFAAHMETRERGFIGVLSSVAGDRGRQSNYLYGAAKGGLSTYLQGLRNRLHHKGITVTTIKPGFMDTKMTWGKPGLFLVASPQAAAKAIHKAIEKGKNVVYIPFFWFGIMSIIKAIPEWQFKKMKM